MSPSRIMPHFKEPDFIAPHSIEPDLSHLRTMIPTLNDSSTPRRLVRLNAISKGWPTYGAPYDIIQLTKSPNTLNRLINERDCLNDPESHNALQEYGAVDIARKFRQRESLDWYGGRNLALVNLANAWKDLSQEVRVTVVFALYEMPERVAAPDCTSGRRKEAEQLLSEYAQRMNSTRDIDLLADQLDKVASIP